MLISIHYRPIPFLGKEEVGQSWSSHPLSPPLVNALVISPLLYFIFLLQSKPILRLFLIHSNTTLLSRVQSLQLFGETLNGDILDISIKWEKFLRTQGLLRGLKIQLQIQLFIPLHSMASLGWGGSGKGMVPFHGRNFICPPCCHFAMPMVSIKNTKLGDIFPFYHLTSWESTPLHMKNEHNHINGNKSYNNQMIAMGQPCAHSSMCFNLLNAHNNSMIQDYINALLYRQGNRDLIEQEIIYLIVYTDKNWKRWDSSSVLCDMKFISLTYINLRSLQYMGLEKTNFIDIFYLKDITDKLLELDNSFESIQSNSLYYGKETGAIRLEFFTNTYEDKGIGNDIGNSKEMGRQNLDSSPLIQTHHAQSGMLHTVQLKWGPFAWTG